MTLVDLVDLFVFWLNFFVATLIVLYCRIIIHELGHTFSLWSVGGSIIEFNIGTGKNIFSLKKIRVNIHPFGGSIKPNEVPKLSLKQSIFFCTFRCGFKCVISFVYIILGL